MSTNRATFEKALHQGHLLSWDQRWEAALQAFYTALQASPDEPTAYAGLGMAYLELNQLPEALENYQLAARHSNGDIIYLRQVADVQERLGQREEAGRTYLAMGEQAYTQQRLLDAVDFWHQAARLAPELMRAHQRLAAYYQREGISHNAVREYLALADLLLRKGDRARAKQMCLLAQQIDPHSPEVLTALELLAQGSGTLQAPTTAAPSINRMAQAAESRATAVPAAAWTVETAVPVQDARRVAQSELARQVFADEADPDQQQRANLISKALDYQTRGLTNEAISTYEQAVALGETQAAVHFNLGTLYQDKLRFEDAIREYQLALADPKYRPASHFALGECHQARGRVGEAIEHFVTVLKILDLGTVRRDQADQLIVLYENLSRSLITHGAPEEATNFANALVRFLNQKGWEDKVRLARQRLDAISSPDMMILGDVLTAASEQVLESLYLSQEYARRGLYNAAIEETFRAIQLAPDYMPAHTRLAELLAEQGRLEAAALKYVKIADAYRARGEVNHALRAYEQGARLAPLDVSIRARLINLLRQYGQIDRALEYYASLGRAYEELGQLDRAAETYTQALTLSARGQDPVAWQRQFHTAVARLDMRRYQWREALDHYQTLRELDPQDDGIARTLVDLYYKVGQPNNAVRALDSYLMQLARSGRSAEIETILQDMVRQRPYDSPLVYRLSRLYAQQDRNTAAIALLDQLGEAQLSAGDTAGALQTIGRILQLDPPDKADYTRLLDQLKHA